MGLVIYYILIFPISLLPLFALYFISDILYILGYKLFVYRKKVVKSNISKSFPKLPKTSQDKLVRTFYRHFFDLILEGIKGFTISTKQLKKRIIVKNPEIANLFFTQGKDVIFVCGHFNNWEWAGAISPLWLKHELFAIYHPLSNKYLDGKLKKSRANHGLQLTPMQQTQRLITANSQLPKGIIMVADQSPSNPHSCHWTTFLNQETGVLMGPEKLAMKYDLPVIYLNNCKVKRGKYQIELELLTEQPTRCKPGEITELYTKRLEKQIIENPSYWLWSHRRWKINKPK